MKLKDYLLLNTVNPCREEKELLENGFVVISKSIDNDTLMFDFDKDFKTTIDFGLIADDIVIGACKTLNKKLVIYTKEDRNV